MSYRSHDSVVESLEGRWPEHRVAPSLTRIAAIVDMLGHPEQTSPVVQITGTNGKGSTAIIVDALLRAVGLRTGRFSSPHLEDITERICVDGHPISEALFDETWTEIEPIIEMVDREKLDGVSVTFFEAITALAYAVFADAPVDVAVMEVGMGGRWDATNVADAAVAVVAPVGLDHMQYLGDTIGLIASEKAGIIKAESVAVVADQTPEAAEVIAERCLEVGAALVAEGRDFAVLDRQLAAGGQLLRLATPNGTIGDLFLPLHGEHMAHNAALAVAAVEQLLGRAIDPDLIQRAFDNVVAPARLELVSDQPPVVLDTAHNPAAVTATLAAVTEAFAFEPVIGVLGMMADKAVDQVLALLEPVVQTLVVTQVTTSPRALPVGALAAMASEVFGDARVIQAGDAEDALNLAQRLASRAGERAGVLVLGSVYLAGEVRTIANRQRMYETESFVDDDISDDMYD